MPIPAADLSDPIHLLCAADARYGAYAGIMLASVLRANPGERFEVHLLSDHMRRRDLRKLTDLVEQAGAGCVVYDVAPRLARGYPLIIDAMLVIVLAAVLALRGAGLPSRLVAWISLLAVLVAAAGPVINIALASIAALAFHICRLSSRQQR